MGRPEPQFPLLYTSSSKNSNGDQSQNRCRDWPDFIRFWFFSFFWEGPRLREGTGVTVHLPLGLKLKEKSGLGRTNSSGFRQPSTQQHRYMQTVRKKKHKQTHTNHAQEAWKHAGWIPCRPVQYREEKLVYLTA